MAGVTAIISADFLLHCRSTVHVERGTRQVRARSTMHLLDGVGRVVGDV